MDRERMMEKIERLEQKIDRLEGRNSEKDQKEEKGSMSRRDFMKKVGLGAAGLGALTIPAASKVTVGSNSITKDGNDFWYSGLSKSFDLSGQNLTDGSTTIYDTSQGQLNSSVVPQSKSLPIVVPAVNLAAGETIQITRFNVPAGKQIKVWKAVVSKLDGTSDGNLSIEVYNQTDATSIYSTTSNTLQEGSPLASGGTGDEIEVRLKNSDGSAGFNAHATLVATVE
ncbi:MAG: twin-arginine translocation signal domain-containing protein [Candidatus Nanohaloarchaea archaeon]